MHKLMIVLMAIFFLGDPSLQTMAWLGEMKTEVDPITDTVNQHL